MKKAVLREYLKNRENKGFTFTVDDVDSYKEGAIEKVVKEIVEETKSKKKSKKGDK